MFTRSTRTAARRYARLRPSGVPAGTPEPEPAAGATTGGADAAAAAATAAAAAAAAADPDTPLRCCCCGALGVPTDGIPVKRCRMPLAFESVFALFRVAQAG